MHTRKVPVVDVLHGVSVEDPYRWLEDGDSLEVRAWDEAQNARTRAYLAAIPGTDALRARIKELLSVGMTGAPVSRALPSGMRRYFHVRREGTQEQAVLCVREGVLGKDRVLIDPAPMSLDGTTAIDWWSVSDEGDRVAWGMSEAGSEESTLRIRDVTSGEDLPDAIPHTRHASVAWMPGGRSFFYTRFPTPGDVAPGDEKYHSRVFAHTVGDDWKSDPLVFGEGRDKLDVPSVVSSPDGRWLVVCVHIGWQRSEVWLRDLQTDGAWVAVATGVEALYEPTLTDDTLYLLTNDGAPRYKLVAAHCTEPARSRWREVLPESEDVLTDVTVIGGADRTLIATYLHEASARVERFTELGASLGPIELPVLGSAHVSGAFDAGEVFIELTSFATPWTVLRFDPDSGTTTAWDHVGEGFSLPDVNVSMLYATSKDGTRIPMFVVEKAGTPRDGDRPCILYGYGGFNIAQTPAFSVRTLTTVEQGGVWAVALLRGGSEFGEDWHRGGMLDRKQNVFDDLYACAEELTRAKVTRPGKLAVAGGSNGGLLVAVAVTQRPELFRAGLCLVPLTDMLRFHRFRIGNHWTAEYGSPDEASAFAWLHAYSPYHQAKPSSAYPSLLIGTAESDSRVDPMHARKFAARLQEFQTATDHPILLRVESRAGHGAGKPIAKVAEAMTEELSFVFHELNVG